MTERRRPLVVEVKRNSLDDGPGIRTTIFFKGCPLRCVWCHNPETKNPGPEIMRSEAECLRCGECAKVCPTGATREGPLLPSTPSPPTRDPARPARDSSPPTRDPAPSAILENLRRLAGIARDTPGPASVPMGPTGSEPRLPALSGPELLVRVPLVPGIATDRENLGAIAGILRQLGLRRVALLPYNPLWIAKAKALGRDPGYAHGRMMAEGEIRECAGAFEGLRVVI